MSISNIAIIFQPHSGQYHEKTFFTASRKQLHRMAAIVTLLKQHEWVTMKCILERMAETEFTDGAYLGCKNRTIQRDIKALQMEYQSPIEYSKVKSAYRLSSKEWTFQVPALLNPDELLAIVIGGKLSQDIFPSSISKRVTRAVNEVLRYNESEESTEELMTSLKVLTEAPAVTQDQIFEIIFEAWHSRHMLRINYADKKGESVLRDIEPHTLVFHEMQWSIKGYCHLRHEPRTFHLAGIRSALILDKTFKASREIIDSVTPDTFLDYKKIPNVTIWLNEEGKRFAAIYTLHSKQSFTKDDDGNYNMFVPAVSLERIVPWMLRQQGNAKPVSPPLMTEAVRDAIRHLADVCQAYDPNEIVDKVKEQVKQEGEARGKRKAEEERGYPGDS